MQKKMNVIEKFMVNLERKSVKKNIDLCILKSDTPFYLGEVFAKNM